MRGLESGCKMDKRVQICQKIAGRAKNNSWWCVAREERKRGNLGVDGRWVGMGLVGLKGRKNMVL